MRQVLGNGFVTEVTAVELSTEEEIQEFKDILELNPKIVYQGEQTSNKFFALPKEMINALKETLDYKKYSEQTETVYVKH